MAAKKSARKKMAKSKSRTGRASSRKSVSRSTKQSATAKSQTAARRPSRLAQARTRRVAALGRPRVAGTAELQLMFQKDLEAREVFSFLGVKTLNELESLAPDEIVERLTAPVVRTVGRIRKVLAMNNRCLAGDQKFAVAFKKQLT